MTGYCAKDNGEEHFEFLHRNVLAVDVNDNQMQHTKFNKVGLSNRVILSRSSILQGPHQWRGSVYISIGCLFAGTLYHMCNSGQMYPNSTWGSH